MKIETTIKPRRNGTVNAVIAGMTYIFAADEQGRLVVDVEDTEHLAFLLSIGDFMPADEDDFEVAKSLIAQDEEDEPDLDEEDEAGPPLEENTPPSLKKPRKVK